MAILNELNKTAKHYVNDETVYYRLVAELTKASSSHLGVSGSIPWLIKSLTLLSFLKLKKYLFANSEIFYVVWC